MNKPITIGLAEGRCKVCNRIMDVCVEPNFKNPKRVWLECDNEDHNV